MFFIPSEKMAKGPKQCLKYLKDHYPEYSGIQFKIHKNPALNEELLKIEMRLVRLPPSQISFHLFPDHNIMSGISFFVCTSNPFM
jgi:hypothetical protein